MRMLFSLSRYLHTGYWLGFFCSCREAPGTQSPLPFVRGLQKRQWQTQRGLPTMALEILTRAPLGMCFLPSSRRCVLGVVDSWPATCQIHVAPFLTSARPQCSNMSRRDQPKLVKEGHLSSKSSRQAPAHHLPIRNRKRKKRVEIICRIRRKTTISQTCCDTTKAVSLKHGKARKTLAITIDSRTSEWWDPRRPGREKTKREKERKESFFSGRPYSLRFDSGLVPWPLPDLLGFSSGATEYFRWKESLHTHLPVAMNSSPPPPPFPL